MKYVNTSLLPTLDVNADDYTMAQSSVVYYQDKDSGQWVEYQTVHGQENRVWVDIGDMAPGLWEAAVSIEDERFFTLGYANWFGLPAPIWLTVACLVVFGLLLNKTTFGRNTLAIGGNEEAARLAGVPVVRTKIIIFVLSGLVSAAAGIIRASRMTSGQPMTSIGYELIVISACVLGGVSLKGGIGKISYVVAGILILGTVENAMNLLNISPFSQYVVRGVILLAAVIFDRYKQKAKRAV